MPSIQFVKSLASGKSCCRSTPPHKRRWHEEDSYQQHVHSECSGYTDKEEDSDDQSILAIWTAEDDEVPKRKNHPDVDFLEGSTRITETQKRLLNRSTVVAAAANKKDDYYYYDDDEANARAMQEDEWNQQQPRRISKQEELDFLECEHDDEALARALQESMNDRSDSPKEKTKDEDKETIAAGSAGPKTVIDCVVLCSDDEDGRKQPAAAAAAWKHRLLSADSDEAIARALQESINNNNEMYNDDEFQILESTTSARWSTCWWSRGDKPETTSDTESAKALQEEIDKIGQQNKFLEESQMSSSPAGRAWKLVENVIKLQEQFR
ncbi:hypothetical protein ACA910_011869 [Epithemia clementina (nom. ined.)]